MTNFNDIIDLCHNLSYIESSNESDNKTVVNTYNGEGRRVKKQVLNGSTTKYLYDGNKVIAEFFDDNSVKAVNVYGLNLVLRFGAGSSDYYMYNGHADVTALINASKDGLYTLDIFSDSGNYCIIFIIEDKNGTLSMDDLFDFASRVSFTYEE